MSDIYRKTAGITTTPGRVGELPTFPGSWLIAAKSDVETTLRAFLGPYKVTPRTWTIPKDGEAVFIIPGHQVIELQANSTDSAGTGTLSFTGVPIEADAQWANPGYLIGSNTFTAAGNKTLVDDDGVTPYGDKLWIACNTNNAASTVVVGIYVTVSYATTVKAIYLGDIDLSTNTNAVSYDLPMGAVVDVQANPTGTFGGSESITVLAWSYTSSGR